MHLDRRLLSWGLFFILLGAVPLLVRGGYVSTDVASRAWQLWPLLIVGIGVSILLRRTSLEPISGLLTATTLGLMLGGLLAVGFGGVSIGCGGPTGGTAFAGRTGTFDSTSASVRLELTCGDLNATTAAGSGWKLDGADRDGSGPSVDASGANLTVRSPDKGISFLDARQRWNLTLPAGPTLDLSATLNAGSGHLDLGAAALGNVDLTLNAGDIHLDLGQTTALDRVGMTVNAGSAKMTLPNRSLTGSVTVNAGSAGFCTPSGAGVRIRTNDNLTAGNNFAGQGLTKNGNTWTTANFDSAAVQIDLSAQANAGSLELNPTGGCND